ncbi:unnamed protein product [Closterium sp. NIES-53]
MMPFGLTNAPAIFQMTMKEAFRPLLDKCVIIYLDEILVYSRDKQQHVADLEAVFTVLDEHRRLTKGSKCEFFQDRLEFSGHVISEVGVEIDPKKLTGLFTHGYQTDPFFTGGNPQHFAAAKGVYYVKAGTDRIWVPGYTLLRESLLQEAHDGVTSGHFGEEKHGSSYSGIITGPKC